MEPLTHVRDISRIAYGFMASKALFASLNLDLFSRLSGQTSRPCRIPVAPQG